MRPEIEEDRAGWKGTGDLHVWGFGSRDMGDGNKIRSLDATLALTPEKELLKLLRSELGDSLSIFKVNSRRDHPLFILAAMPPNLERPDAPRTTTESSAAGAEIAKRNESFVIKHPILDVNKRHFTTRIDFLGDALKRLQTKENVSIDQSSTCTLTVNLGATQVPCDYAFPVDYQTTKLVLSRAQGWLEVTTPLLTSLRRGRFCSNPFPVLSTPESRITNCFTPYINFRQLPPLDRRLAHVDAHSSRVDNPCSVPDHLAVTMFTTEERKPPLYKTPAVIKLHIHSLLFPYERPTIVALSTDPPNDRANIPFLFMVHGLYLDFNSRSVAAEAYFLPMTKGVPQIYPEVTLPATSEHLKWWRNTLPSMFESARTWTHTSECEYKTEGIPRHGPSPICSCGNGKVGPEFKDVAMWRKFGPYVTRIAILPIFAVPWLTPARQTIDDSGVTREYGSSTTTPTTGPAKPKIGRTHTNESKIRRCKFCAKKDAAKQCGKCMSVSYCSQACQRNDWKTHKKVCGVKE
jgi:hypothetical protein